MHPSPSALATTASARPTAARAAPRPWSGLQAAVTAWLGVALAGQLIFATYVLVFYGGHAAAGRLAQWNAVTPRAWRPGETLGNLVFGSHVLFAVVIVLGGMVQLLPVLRRRAPALHRWNGRLYLLASVVLSLGGLAMLLTRGTVGSVGQHLGVALNGAVILVCACMAWRHARAQRMALHRRWALRLFLSVSGVWFFRIGLMAWLAVWRAPVGFDPASFSGPFLSVLAMAQFMLPLAVLELVLHAQASTQRGLRAAAAVLVAAMTGLTALGIAAATAGMWWRHL